MTAYYNEIDPYAAQWLRNLIAKNLIAPGDVDERSIVDVHPDDIKGYTQCHFFAGIGGWSYALRLAGWPDDRPVWTGSCPCQSFSAAGKQNGRKDERHLWPIWGGLIEKQRPSILFGEQVAAAVAFGWLDEVFYDLEASSYACAAAVLPSVSVNQPHRRDRLFFVAHAGGAITGRRDPVRRRIGRSDEAEEKWTLQHALATSGSRIELADGLPTGVAKGVMRGFGNAIVPQIAAEFIGAYMEIAA